MSTNTSRSGAVRGAARAHLAQLRAERRARRVDVEADVVPAVPIAEPPAAALKVSRAAAEAALPVILPQPPSPADDMHEAPVSASAPETETHAPAEDGPAAAEAAPAPDATEVLDEAEDIAVDVANDEAVAERDGVTVEPLLDAPGAKEEASDDPVRTRLDRSDLFRLPGIGIGLVWMLDRCDVTSLADLASADAERLALRLGLVGELLDLPSWIALARELSTEAAS